jgi:hypothetical protein
MYHGVRFAWVDRCYRRSVENGVSTCRQTRDVYGGPFRTRTGTAGLGNLQNDVPLRVLNGLSWCLTLQSDAMLRH